MTDQPAANAAPFDVEAAERLAESDTYDCSPAIATIQKGLRATLRAACAEIRRLRAAMEAISRADPGAAMRLYLERAERAEARVKELEDGKETTCDGCSCSYCTDVRAKAHRAEKAEADRETLRTLLQEAVESIEEDCDSTGRQFRLAVKARAALAEADK